MTLYAKAVLTDAWGIDHAITPQGAGGSEVLKLFLAYGGVESKSFTFTLQDIDVRKSWLTKGCTVKFYVDSSNPPTTLVLTGQVEDIERTQSSVVSLQLVITGRERAYIRALERIVVEAYLDSTPSTILHHLLANYIPYEDETVLVYSFYEATGAVLHDESPSANHGAITGGTWNPTGKVGNCLDLNGSSDHIDVAAAVTLSGPFTVMFWAKRTSTAGYDAVLGHPTNTATIGYNTGADQAYIRILDAGSSDTPACAAFGAWELITVTRDADGKVDFYSNGGAAVRLFSDVAQVGNFIFSLLGNNSASSWFLGSLDELRVWERCLSAQEILDFYTHGYTHYIAPYVDTAIEDIRFDYKFLKVCLDTLAKIASSRYYWTATGMLRFGLCTTTDSTIDYTDSNILELPKAKNSLIPIKNKVYLIGGLQKTLDKSETTNGGHSHSSANWYAQDFVPSKTNLSQISLLLAKVGTPAANLEGGIYTDNAGVPGVQLAGFSFDEEYISTTVGWKPTEVLASLIVGEVYWIVVKKVGATSNDYLWYHDGHSTHTHAYSADGVSWTISSSSYHFCHKTYYDVRILASKEDATNEPTWGWRETVRREDSIKDKASATAYVSNLLTQLTNELPHLSDITILNPLVVPSENTYVGVSFIKINVAADYDVKSVSVGWKAGQVGTTRMVLAIGNHLEALSEFLASLKTNVDQLSAIDLGTGTLIDLLRGLADSKTITVTEDLTATESTTTTYISESFADLDDWVAALGTWHIDSGHAECNTTTTGDTSRLRYNGTYVDTLPTDYYFEGKTRCKLYEVARMGVLVRADMGAGDCYEIRADPYYDYVAVLKWDGWAQTILSRVYDTPYPLSLTTWYTLKFYQRDAGAGWRCEVWLDGNLVIDYTEATRTHSGTGRLYLTQFNYTSAGAKCEYDDVTVWALV